jgi:hypothetical protein
MLRATALVVKGLFYLTLIAVCSPVLWWMGRSGDSFEGETFAEYDDNDLGEDVDGE